MRTIICKNYDEMSEAAASLVISRLTLNPASVIGFATGSTPIGLYEKLIEANKNGKVDFSECTTFNLDEYYPIAPDNSQSYHYFMNENLFSKVNVNPERIHIPDGLAEDPEAECRVYDETIDAFGGIDLQILGIGQNGHIGFNEPDESLVLGTHLTGLTESTVKANSRFFASEDEVPKKALTMGIKTILKSRMIVLLANGASKRDALKALFDDSITTSNPATFLKLHPNVVIICDEEAAGK